MLNTVLEKAGLSKNEAKVYTALLELGLSNASAIVRRTGLHRPNVYYSIVRLTEKGLISSCLKQNVNFYQAASPKSLMNLVRQREDETKALRQDVIGIMTELETLAASSREESQTVELFRGIEGFKTVREHTLDNAEKNGYCIIGYTGIARRTLGQNHIHWEERRVRRGIMRKALASEENREYLSKQPLTKVRYLPGQYTSPASTTVYSDRVVIHLMENKKPLAIMIKSKGLANAYKSYFKLLWSISKD
jgi:sugar-specific transcriptional regulator TrmB